MNDHVALRVGLPDRVFKTRADGVGVIQGLGAVQFNMQVDENG